MDTWKPSVTVEDDVLTLRVDLTHARRPKRDEIKLTIEQAKGLAQVLTEDPLGELDHIELRQTRPFERLTVRYIRTEEGDRRTSSFVVLPSGKLTV